MQYVIEAVSQQYDKAYYKAQALFDEYNPCQRVVHSCGGLTCVAKHTPGPLCCPGCRYHSDTGCTVMCLGCKVSLCYAAGDNDEFRGKMATIKMGLPHDVHCGLLDIHRSKEEVMEELTRDLTLRYRHLSPERKIAWNVLSVKGM